MKKVYHSQSLNEWVCRNRQVFPVRENHLNFLVGFFRQEVLPEFYSSSPSSLTSIVLSPPFIISYFSLANFSIFAGISFLSESISFFKYSFSSSRLEICVFSESISFCNFKYFIIPLLLKTRYRIPIKKIAGIRYKKIFFLLCFAIQTVPDNSFNQIF